MNFWVLLALVEIAVTAYYGFKSFAFFVREYRNHSAWKARVRYEIEANCIEVEQGFK